MCPYSDIEYRICDITGKAWLYNGKHRKISPHTKSLKEQYYKKCSFKFNVYDYPNIFDLSLITKYGWYSCPGKKRKDKIKNINGVSRDHKVSINEGYKKSYDTYYMSHIMNCDLILHSENKIKNTSSSISYDELIRLVDEYDKSSMTKSNRHL